MNLGEILKKNELSEDAIKAINKAVDTLIDGKVSVKETEINTLTGKLEELNGELAPFKTKARQAKIATLMPKNANSDLQGDIISLANISEDDDDKAIAAKLEATVKERTFLQANIDAPELKQTKVIKTEKEKEPKTYRFVK